MLQSANANGSITGVGVQNALGGLRDEARGLTTSGASSHYDRLLGRALSDVRDHVTRNFETYSTPDVVRKFRNVNEAFANLVRVQEAATSVAAEGGVFTPAMLRAAVKKSDKSARKRASARGEALGQDLAEDAKSVMTRRTADSGPPERATVAGVIGSMGYMNPWTLAGPAALALGQTPAAHRAFQRAATMSPQTGRLIRRLIQQGTDRAAPAAGLAATAGD